MQSEILIKVKEFATTLLKHRLSEKLYFHNITHTLEVVQATSEIGVNSALSKEELEIVLIAAWFHDLGYSDKYKDHEYESANIAFIFLTITGIDEIIIEHIISCILATKYPQKPLSLLEKVICDADLYHFSRPDYKQHEQALKKEWEANLNLIYTDKEWDIINYDMLKDHVYWTSYGKTVLQLKKEENIKKLKQS